MFQGVIKYDPSREYYFDEGCYINELSNIKEDNAVSMALARVPVGIKTKKHKLLNTIERYLILEGKGLVYLGDNPPEIVTFGDVIHIPPDCSQCIENIGNSDLVFLVVCTPRFNKEVYKEID